MPPPPTKSIEQIKKIRRNKNKANGLIYQYTKDPEGSNKRNVIDG